MPAVLKAVAFGSPRRHREHGIEAVQCLYGGLLVHTEQGRVLRRVQVQANDIGSFVLKVGVIAGSYEGMAIHGSRLPAGQGQASVLYGETPPPRAFSV